MTAVALFMDAAAAAAEAAEDAGEHSPPSPTEAAVAPPPAPPELAMVARAVQRLVARNDAVAGPVADGRGGGMKAFEAAKGAAAPRIGVAEYLERVHRYAGLEPECYVVAYAYVDMAAHRRPAAAVASRNVHRLLLACLLVASKVLDDFHHDNAFFARVGGVSNAEMNRLELELLDVLDFAVAVDHRTYDRYREHLKKEMRRDHRAPLLGAMPKPRAGAASTVMPLLTLTKEHSAEVGADDHEEHCGRKQPPNGVLAAAKKSVPAGRRTARRRARRPFET